VAFRGWPAAAIDFFTGLEADNSKRYWTAHREVYEESVKAPFLALSEAVEREFGPLHVFRPYRDVRFSKDKTPYKTSAAAVTEGPGGTSYYVQISSEGLYAGSGYYVFAADQLERWRAAVADARSGPQIEREVAAVRKKRLEADARESLKRAPRGYDPDHPRVDLLRLKGLHAGRSFTPARWLHTGSALTRITDTWRAAAGMNRWLDRHVGPSTLAPPEPD
jgi:uncharacterized protein (TIGR02453 family)